MAIIRPGFSGTVPQTKILYRKKFVPNFLQIFLSFQFYTAFLIIFFRMETFVDLSATVTRNR
jgi:hypothetical protein